MNTLLLIRQVGWVTQTIWAYLSNNQKYWAQSLILSATWVLNSETMCWIMISWSLSWLWDISLERHLSSSWEKLILTSLDVLSNKYGVTNLRPSSDAKCSVNHFEEAGLRVINEFMASNHSFMHTLKQKWKKWENRSFLVLLNLICTVSLWYILKI